MKNANKYCRVFFFEGKKKDRSDRFPFSFGLSYLYIICKAARKSVGFVIYYNIWRINLDEILPFSLFFYYIQSLYTDLINTLVHSYTNCVIQYLLYC
jgi:hypothetical protein